MLGTANLVINKTGVFFATSSIECEMTARFQIIKTRPSEYCNSGRSGAPDRTAPSQEAEVVAGTPERGTKGPEDE